MIFPIIMMMMNKDIEISSIADKALWGRISESFSRHITECLADYGEDVKKDQEYIDRELSKYNACLVVDGSDSFWDAFEMSGVVEFQKLHRRYVFSSAADKTFFILRFSS